MTDTLHDFVLAADRKIEKMFRHQGRVLPMFHFVDGAGEHGVSPAPSIENRDLAAEIVRANVQGALRHPVRLHHRGVDHGGAG